MDSSITNEVIAEQLAEYYASNPAAAFQIVWTAYIHDYLPLAEAAAAIGCTIKQFCELAKHYPKRDVKAVPQVLLAKATPDEKFLLTCLPQRYLDILLQLRVKDILLPKTSRYVNPLWEDLWLLRNLRLVRESEKGNLLRYSLNLQHQNEKHGEY